MSAPGDADPRGASHYTVVYRGHPRDCRILSGEPACGTPVTVVLGDCHEELRRTEKALAASEADRAALERRVAELEGALRPFVVLAKYVQNRRNDEFVGYPIEVKQLHAAARALTPGASS